MQCHTVINLYKYLHKVAGKSGFYAAHCPRVYDDCKSPAISERTQNAHIMLINVHFPPFGEITTNFAVVILTKYFFKSSENL